MCSECQYEYHRDYEVELPTAINHETGRICEQAGCSGKLNDNIVHFDEALPFHALKMANAKFIASHIAIAVGTTLPAASLPFRAKRRSRFQNPKTCIIILQPTLNDDEADLVIHATCEEVLCYLETLLE